VSIFQRNRDEGLFQQPQAIAQVCAVCSPIRSSYTIPSARRIRLAALACGSLFPHPQLGRQPQYLSAAAFALPVLVGRPGGGTVAAQELIALLAGPNPDDAPGMGEVPEAPFQEALGDIAGVEDDAVDVEQSRGHTPHNNTCEGRAPWRAMACFTYSPADRHTGQCRFLGA
jgi:hypothetical protein